MGRIMALDYGRARIGVAVTDPLRISAHALDTIGRELIWAFLEQYFSQEVVDMMVIGEPLHADGTKSDNHGEVMAFARRFSKLFPTIPVAFQNEYLSSSEARDAILLSVPSRKKRRDKALVDKVSAVIILQRFLGHY